jgi:hypothetical protein
VVCVSGHVRGLSGIWKKPNWVSVALIVIAVLSISLQKTAIMSG